MLWFEDVKADFVLNFIEKERYKLLLTGFKNTLTITVFALLLGIIIGVVVAVIRSSYDKNSHSMHGIGKGIMAVLNAICKVYLTVIRGTPVVVQLLIMYLIILVDVRNSVYVAIATFGINSGAYVAEIIRAGISSIDQGQMEAGRSLGFGYVKTMWYIIIPQAFKNVLPALLNEFIALFKETSIAGYVGIRDLTKAGELIRSQTFTAMMPLIVVALVYLGVVMLLTWLVGKLERRLKKSDNR
jgi:His/Glu/Gln/Arg/opine family amino acid ABC transporter permease subunit